MAASEIGSSTLSVQPANRSGTSTGYYPMLASESYQQRTGLRGRKGLAFYGLVIVLFIIALSNLALTIVLLSVLRIGYGMESLELVPPSLLIRFLKAVDLGTVVVTRGEVGGLARQDLPLMGINGQSVIFQSGSGPRLEVGPDKTDISGIAEFNVRSPSTGATLFSTLHRNDFGLPAATRHLVTETTQAARVVSPRNDSLLLHSPYQILLKGNEGLVAEARNISWTAGQDLYLHSVNASIILDGKEGIRLAMDKIPVATLGSGPAASAPRWYKLCACMHSDQVFRVFRVPVREHGFGCNDVRFPASKNPCT